MLHLHMIDSDDDWLYRQRCVHCQKRLQLGEVVVSVPVKGIAAPVVHRRCLLDVLKDSPPDSGSFEEIRARIVETGDAFAEV